MLVKENYYRAINLLALLDRIFLRYLFYSYQRAKDKYSKNLQVDLEFVQWCLFIRWQLPKTITQNCFLISFCDQTAMTVVNLFKHLLQTMCFYSSMLVLLKRVEYNKLFESVLRLMGIRVAANIGQYLQKFIQVLLLLNCI